MSFFKNKKIQKQAQLYVSKEKERDAFQSPVNIPTEAEQSSVQLRDNVPQKAKEKSLTRSFSSLFRRKPVMKPAPAMEAEPEELFDEPVQEQTVIQNQTVTQQQTEVRQQTEIQEQTQIKELSEKEKEREKKKEQIIEEGEKTYTSEYARSLKKNFALQEILDKMLGKEADTSGMSAHALKMLKLLQKLADGRVNSKLAGNKKNDKKAAPNESNDKNAAETAEARKARIQKENEEKKRRDAIEDEIAEAMNFFATYNDDMKKLLKETAGTETIDKKYEEFKNKYRDRYGLTDKDHELIGVCAGLCVVGHGNMDTEAVDKKDVRDYSDKDDIFLNKTKKDKTKIDPPKVSDDRTYVSTEMRMTAYHAPLFRNTPSPKDVSQGNLGDCYFITAVNVIVEKDPGGLIRMELRDFVQTFKSFGTVSAKTDI